ncbi:hypothetical protein F5887DRAFT_149336, partial [Amanita rubescens]
MLVLGLGYPLYMPSPSETLPMAYRKKGIRVGDVGVISKNGAFDFLFNACRQREEPDGAINPVALPEDFELLDADINVHNKYNLPTHLLSSHVNALSSLDSSCAFAFKCSEAGGAVLALPRGATVYEATNKRHFQQHAARHAVSWYKYLLNTGRDVTNGSLYFVTDCIKSANWGIATFYASQADNDYLHLIFDERSCRWKFLGKVEARDGPGSMDIVASDGGEPNQCVFLCGYKIMLQPRIWDELWNAVLVGSQGGESWPYPGDSQSHLHGTSGGRTDSYQGSSADGNTTHMDPGSCIPRDQASTMDTPESWLGQVMLEEFCSTAAPVHPSDLINVMLLHLLPEVTVSLVHDSEWCDHLPDDFMADPTNPNVDGLLENVKRSYKVVVDQYDCAVHVSSSETNSEVQESCKVPSEVTQPAITRSGGSTSRGSPMRRRNRVVACLSCRKRKTRCNAGEGVDTCDKCRTLRRPCITLPVICEDVIRLHDYEPENMPLDELRSLIRRFVQQG